MTDLDRPVETGDQPEHLLRSVPPISVPLNLSRPASEAFVADIQSYARALKAELDKEPTPDGARGAGEVARAVDRLRRPRSASPAKPSQAMPVSHVATRQAMVNGLVALGGACIPYLGYGLGHFVGYLVVVSALS
ncbi:MAG: hypothetical protein ACRCYU_09230 [Nocardioides sp.]